MSDSQHVLPKRELAALLQVSIPGLRNWWHEGAPLREDLSGDPVEVISWYLARPLFSLQWSVVWRYDNYPALARKIQRERRKATKAVETEKR